MGRVDLDFKPAVPVFDANVALGRRHNRRQSVDTAAATIAEMDRTGVERALVYAPHAAVYDSLQGNSYLLESIAGCPRLVPQFACNPTFDHMNRFAAGLEEHGVRWVIAHAGNGPLGQDEAVAAAQACANIYLETSTSFGDSRTIEYLVQGRERSGCSSVRTCPNRSCAINWAGSSPPTSRRTPGAGFWV